MLHERVKGMPRRSVRSAHGGDVSPTHWPHFRCRNRPLRHRQGPTLKLPQLRSCDCTGIPKSQSQLTSTPIFNSERMASHALPAPASCTQRPTSHVDASTYVDICICSELSECALCLKPIQVSNPEPVPQGAWLVPGSWPSENQQSASRSVLPSICSNRQHGNPASRPHWPRGQSCTENQSSSSRP